MFFGDLRHAEITAASPHCGFRDLGIWHNKVAPRLAWQLLGYRMAGPGANPAPPCYTGDMKQSDKPIRLEDVELVPDAMERLEGAIKHAARKPAEVPAKSARRVTPAKPKCRPQSTRP